MNSPQAAQNRIDFHPGQHINSSAPSDQLPPKAGHGKQRSLFLNQQMLQRRTGKPHLKITMGDERRCNLETENTSEEEKVGGGGRRR